MLRQALLVLLSLVLILGPLDDAVFCSCSLNALASAPSDSPLGDEEEEHNYTIGPRASKRAWDFVSSKADNYAPPSKAREESALPFSPPHEPSPIAYPPRHNGFGGLLRC
jgi:hypothetical protein